MSRETLLRVSSLTKSYPVRGRREPFTALRNLDIEVAEGGSVAVVGESGSGKSTAARIIAGLERQTAGEVEIAGQRIPQRRLGYRERRWRSSIVQMVFQDPYQSLDRRQRVGDAITESLRLHGMGAPADRRARAVDLLAAVGLDERFAGHLPRDLSGGQLQRTAIARALAARPRLLILDEAVSALDVSVQAQVLDLLETIRAEVGLAMLFISHDIGVVAQISDDIVVLRRGVVEEMGPTRRVLRSPQSAYTKNLLASVPRPGWTPRRSALRETGERREDVYG